MLRSGQLAYPGQPYFGPEKQNMITIPTKSANYDPEKINFFFTICHIFALEIKFSGFLSVRALLIR